MTSRRKYKSAIPASVKILLLVVVVVILLAWYSLRYIPYFNIQRVEVVTTQEKWSVPLAANRIVGPLKGLSQFEVNLSELKKEFEQLPVVQSAEVKRRMPDVLRVELELVTPQALVSSIGPDGVSLGMYLVKNNKLLELPVEDYSLYGDTVFTVEVPSEYTSVLLRYGLDDGFRTVLALAAELGAGSDSRNALITRIKYDNNSSNNFGRMVLELPSCNAQLWVREPVSAQLIARSIALIIQDGANDDLRFLEQAPKRYDLYVDALVRR